MTHLEAAAAGTSVDQLLGAADAWLRRGDEMIPSQVTRVALVAGVLHGLALEGQTELSRDAAVRAARGGFALRRAEEDLRATAEPAPLSALLAAVYDERPHLERWDALQIVAWEVTSGDGSLPPQLLDHGSLTRNPVLDDAVGRVAAAARDSLGSPVGIITGAEARCAVRFGHALRAVERSPGRRAAQCSSGAAS